MTRAFTDLELERLLADDPDGPSAAQFEAAATPADREAKQRLAVGDAAFLATTDVEARVAAIVTGVRGASAPGLGSRRRWLVGLAGVAAIAVAVATVVLRIPTPTPEPAAPIALGPVTFQLDVATATTWGPLDSRPVSPGDPLRFAVRAPAAGFIAIAGIDGDDVTWFAPAQGPIAAPYQPNQPAVLATAPARRSVQRIFVVYSRRAFPLAELAAALTGRTARPLDVVVAGPTELRTTGGFEQSDE